jgi:hypothetical protein
MSSPKNLTDLYQLVAGFAGSVWIAMTVQK